jgi:hypothetical protein
MKAANLRFTPLLLSLALVTSDAAAAPRPFALLHSLFDPSTNAQTGAGQGYSVAVDGNIAVVGAPSDDVGGTDSGVVKVYDATTGALLHTLTNPSPAFDDEFGLSVAISGTRVVVGAPFDDIGEFDEGSAYVYDLTSATPTVPVAVLSNPSPEPGDQFGISVAISGTRVVIGANFDSTAATFAGSAYVYDLTSVTPALPMATLINPSPALDGAFGWSVAISGARVVVGAPYDDSGAIYGGRAYVYDLTSVTPALPVATLNNPSPALGDEFGWAVAISGARVVIGVPYDDTGANDAGRAYVYDLATATPALPVATLNNPSPTFDDEFGSSIAISGARVVVGTPYDDTAAAGAGSAYVYDFTSSTPGLPVATLTNPNRVTYDLFGNSVAISGTRVVAGAPGDFDGGTTAGNAYVYNLVSAVPTAPVKTLSDPSPASDDGFGNSVAISGTRVVVGTAGDDTGAFNAGSAYVYDLASATPTVPIVTLTNPNPTPNDSFGYSVAISGTRVVVGAHDAGSAYVYDLTSAVPTVPVATLNNPGPALGGETFGMSVAISDTWVAVGAFVVYTNGTTAGRAYVYDLASATPTVPVTTLTNPSPARLNFFAGLSVAISDTRVIVGAVIGDEGSVCVYDLASATPTMPIATLTNSSQKAYDILGWPVAISGVRVVVGESYLNFTNPPFAGSANVYDLTTSAPNMPMLTLTNPSPASVRLFGHSVAISGTRIVVGAFLPDQNGLMAGNAYLYDLGSATPAVPVATLNLPGHVVNERPRNFLAIDGTTIVAGAPYVDTIAADRGAAYVFGLTPMLNIVPTMPGFARISWTPTTSSGFALQYSDGLLPTNWLNAPSGAANPVTVPTTNPSRFYRLFQR